MSVSHVPQPDNPFLRQVIELAVEEAAELGGTTIDAEHLLLAATRGELDGPATFALVGVDACKVRDFATFICGANEANAARVALSTRRLGTEARPVRLGAKHRRGSTRSASTRTRVR